MNYRLLIVLLVVVPLQALDAQKLSLEFGAQLAITSTVVRVEDTGDKANVPFPNSNPPLMGGFVKLNHRQWGGLRIGVLRHNWARTFCLEGYGCSTSNSLPSELEVELLYSRSFLFKKSKWSIVPALGYGLGIIQGGGNRWFYNEEGLNPPMGSTPFVERWVNSKLNNFYHLINLELMASRELGDGLKVGLFVKYGQGLLPITEERLSYLYEDGTSGEAVFTQNGGYWSLGLRLSYAFKKNDRA